MNEVLECLKTRRAIRKFKPDAVPQELLDQVIEAGLYAPSGKGGQSAIIIAVTNKEKRDELMKVNRDIGGWGEEYDPFYGAPAVLIVLADKSLPFTRYDGSLVMGNLMNAAHAVGLGSIWIHRAFEEFEGDWGKAFLKELGIEGDFEGVAHCAIGYTDGEEPAAKPRNDGRVFWVK
ncbi:MAG: nitroreductase [Firmicutes bacterium]|nr:nitroreductase [Bacillota bacterium]